MALKFNEMVRAKFGDKVTNIIFGARGISLENSQKWWDETEVFTVRSESSC